jgi:hypothetical protein
MQYLKAITALSLAVALFGVKAQAASSSSIQPEKIEDEYTDVTIPMAAGELDTEISTEQAQRERSEQPTSSIDLGVSSYQPNSLNLISRISNPGGFSLVGPPQINLNGLTPMGRDFSLKFGTGFLVLNRSGAVGASDQDIVDSQTAYIISGRAGAEYSPYSFSSSKFHPYATAAIVPTIVMTSRSSFDDGQSAFGVPVELGAGTLVHVLQSWDLDLSIVGTLGKVQDSNMDGLGLNAGVRVHL